MTAAEVCTCVVPVPNHHDPKFCINCGKLTPQAARKAPGPLAGRVQTMPRCIGCGTATAPGVDLCEVCKDKPQYATPKGLMQTGAQPTPAYQRPEYEGNFKPGASDAKPE